VAFFFKVG